MQYFHKQELEELRRSPENKNGELKLYTIFGHLDQPLVTFTKLTQSYVYDDENKKYPYPSKSADYTLFDSKIQAWREFKAHYLKEKKYLEDKHALELKKLNKVRDVLEKCSIETPEYFL